MSESVVDYLVEHGYDPKMGARPLSRKIDELIRVPLSKRILFEGLADCTVQAIVNNDNVEFVVEGTTPNAVVDSDGIIQIDSN